MKKDTKKSWIKEFPNKRFQILLTDSEFVAHQREYHIFAYIVSGELQLTYRERNYIIELGDTILIPAGEIHAFQNLTETGSEVWFHYIDTLDIIGTPNQEILRSIDNVMCTKQPTNSFISILFDEIEHEINRPTYIEFLECLVRSVNSQLEPNLPISKNSFSALVAARNYIEENIDGTFCLESIARLCNIDKWQLSRNFKATFGVSLFQHIHATRIVKAKKLLSLHHSITDVAFECGYSDQSHFNRFFKRFVGISPKKWEKLINGDKLTNK